MTSNEIIVYLAMFNLFMLTFILTIVLIRRHEYNKFCLRYWNKHQRILMECITENSMGVGWQSHISKKYRRY